MKALVLLPKLFCLAFIMVLGFNSCEEKPDNPVPPSDYPRSLAEILSSPEAIKKLTDAGMIIYGQKSDELPIIGKFIMQHICIHDNTIPKNTDKRYSDYEYEFSILPNTTSRVPVVSYKAVNSTVSEISGTSLYVQWRSNNNITVFFEANGEFDGIGNKSIRILSGNLTRDPNGQVNGLVATHDCFIILEAGPDPDDKVADVGTIRIFKAAR